MNGARLRTPGFQYRKRKTGYAQLHCEEVSLDALAERFGTPLYVYSAETLRMRFRGMDRAFGAFPHTICYSVKANSNLSILKLLAGIGSGFDVVSGGELERVLHVSRKAAAQTVFSGVGKSAEEIDAGLRAGILMFNVESESELLLLAKRAGRLKKKAGMAIRVNPQIEAKTHPYISTGLAEHKFGVPIEDAMRLYRQASKEKFLQAQGVSVHIGSQITSVKPFAAAMERVAALVRELRATGFNIGYVDAGGGLGISYHHSDGAKETSVSFEDYASAIQRSLRGLDVHLLLEPGRAIAGPAGALLTRVLYRKQNHGKRFVITDAAMNDLLRPSLYDAYHEIVPVEMPQAAGKKETVDIAGPICESGDFFAHDREMPPVEEGRLLAIMDAGAYGMSLASNYNSRPRAAEVLVDGKKTRLIRKRETTRTMLAPEILR